MLFYIKKIFNTNISFFIILFVVIFSLYGKAVNFEFTNLDDTSLIKNNISYISDIKNIPNLFFQCCFYDNDFQYYRPILSLSFVLETVLFGYNTKVYHTTNIILFILALYLMLLLLLELNSDKNISKIVLLLLSVHPVLMSLSIWIPARNDTLITIFVVLFFISLLKYIKNNKKVYNYLYYLFFMLSLFTKEIGIILIPVYFLFIYSFDIKITKKQLLNDIIVFSIITAFYLFLRNISVSTVPALEIIKNYKILLSNIFNGLLIYTDKLVIPDYVPVILYNLKVTTKTLFLNLFVLMFFIFIYIRLKNLRKQIIFGFLWYILFIFPTFFIQEQQIFFHRLLLPIFGIVFILIQLTDKLTIKYPILYKYFLVLVLMLFIPFSLSSYKEKDKYKNMETFVIDAYLNSNNGRIGDLMFIDMLIQKGDFEKAKELLLNRVKKKITFYEVFLLAKLYFVSGKLEESENVYLQLEKDFPGEKDIIYLPLSEIYYIKEDYEKAFYYIQKAYKQKSYDTSVLKQLAKVLEKKGNKQEALDIYIKLSKIEIGNKEYKDKINLLEKID